MWCFEKLFSLMTCNGLKWKVISKIFYHTMLCFMIFYFFRFLNSQDKISTLKQTMSLTINRWWGLMGWLYPEVFCKGSILYDYQTLNNNSRNILIQKWEKKVKIQIILRGLNPKVSVVAAIRCWLYTHKIQNSLWFEQNYGQNFTTFIFLLPILQQNWRV